MNLRQKIYLGLAISLIFILLSACSPSPEELAATSAAVTKAAASPTPRTTRTPKPTSSPTPTLTPTPTPVPSPDAKAMINWEELNLPTGYRSINTSEMGYGVGDWIMGVQKEDGTQIDYYIENIFAFAEQWPEAVYGWTVKFPTEFDQDLLDAYIEMFPDQLAGIVNGFGGSLISLAGNTENSDIGDNSAEAWAVYALDGWWSFWGASFRIDDIGGFVFLRQPFGDEPFIEISDLAQVYAQSIETPAYSCNFSTISPNFDFDVPAFEYKIEGFYPAEPIMIGISGDVKVDGKSQRISIIDEDPFLTDKHGMYHGLMKFGDEVFELASSEFEIIIISYASNCTVRQVVTWPGNTDPASNPEPTSTQSSISSSESLIFGDDFDQQLEDGWEWLYAEPDEWNLDSKPGYLHIDPALYTEQLLGRFAPEGDFRITSRVIFDPQENFQFAGISILQDDEHKLMFGRAYAYRPNQDCCIGNALYYDNQDKIRGLPDAYLIDSNYATRTDELGEAYLRLTREGSIYTAYYSSDGENWTSIGIHEVDWVPTYVGVIVRGNLSAPTLSADFDYFTIETLP